MQTLIQSLPGYAWPFFRLYQFAEQEIVYYHDEEKNEIRMTLRYEGIFGNLKKSGAVRVLPEGSRRQGHP